jgi:hypothetical protein
MMANLDTGPLYGKIGEAVTRHVDTSPVGSLFFVNAGDGWVEGRIYEDAVDRVIYHLPDDKLLNLSYELWEAEDEDKKWSELHYRIFDGRFTANLVYAEEIDPEEDEDDRHQRILKEIFGDKPVDYGDPDDPKWLD